MNAIRCLIVAVVLGLALSPVSRAQEPPKPGPEHEILKKMEGTWETTMSFGGMEAKGTMVYKMELGGLWLTSNFTGEFGGMKFGGKGIDGYDQAKKKFVGVWVDSMSTGPMMMEGTYDKEKKTLTMNGEGPGMDGKTTKYKSTTEFKDDNTMVMKMYMGEGAGAEAFTITFKRKK